MAACATAVAQLVGVRVSISARPVFRLGYRPELDGIRAIAVFSVMLCHTFVVGKGADLLGPAIVPALVSGGLFGVDIFFVLSGFLITSILLQECATTGRMDLRAFYLRRVLRLSPAMILLLFASSMYLAFFGSTAGGFDLTAVLVSALYISNFAVIFGGLRLGMLTPTWSLSVEEQFYSIWPLALSFLTKINPRKVGVVIVSVAILSMLVRAGFYSAYLISGKLQLFGAANHFLFARADGLMLGALVALAAASGWLPASPNTRFWNMLSWGTLLVLLVILGAGPIDYRPAVFYALYAATGILTALLIGTLIAAPTSLTRVLQLSPMVWVGKISYGLYLFHLPVLALVPLVLQSYRIELQPWLMTGITILMSIGLAAASYYLVELRFLKLKDRIRSPAGNLIVQPAAV